MRDAQDADVLASGSSPESKAPATSSAGSPAAGTTNTAPQPSGTESSGGSRYSRGLGRALTVAAAVIAVDQLTKWWAVNSLSTGPCATADACIELVAGARLRLVFNSGAAFTTGSGYGPLLAVLAMVMTVVLLAMSARRPDRRGAVLLAMVAGGAGGNLIDRVFRADDGPLSGAVIDFIDVGWWPVFNLADSAIVVGTVALVLLTFVQDPADDGPPPDSGAANNAANKAAKDTAAVDTPSGDPVG